MNCVSNRPYHCRESAPSTPTPPPASSPARCSRPEPRTDGAQRLSTLATLDRTEQGWGAFGGCKKDDSGGGGLFGTGLLKGLFGAHSPVLDAIHSVVDDIPIVGDIAKKVCSVVSPEYHKAAEQEKHCQQQPQPQPCPQPPQPQLNIALAISQAGGAA